MSGWTPEEDDFAKARWLAGDSASIIAQKLPGERSRNAVIGRLHRLQCRRDLPQAPPRVSVRYPAGRKSPSNHHRRSIKTKPVKVIVPVGPVDLSNAKPWGELKRHGECCYLIDDPSADARACGAPTGKDGPDWQYCPAHRAVMFERPRKVSEAAARSKAAHKSRSAPFYDPLAEMAVAA